MVVLKPNFIIKEGKNIETPKLKLLYSCAIFFMTSIVLNIFRER